MTWWLALLAGAAPVHLGTPITGGPALRVQQGTAELRPALDLLDLQVQIGRVMLVPRLGRLAAGAAALEILDLEVPVLVRPGPEPDPGWAPLVMVGLAPRLQRGAGRTAAGLRALARIGLAHRRSEQARRTVQLFLEPSLGGDAGPEYGVLDVAVRAGLSVSWRVSP